MAYPMTATTRVFESQTLVIRDERILSGLIHKLNINWTSGSWPPNSERIASRAPLNLHPKSFVTPHYGQRIDAQNKKPHTEKISVPTVMYRMPPRDRTFVAVIMVLRGCIQTDHKLGEQNRRMVRLRYRLRAV